MERHPFLSLWVVGMIAILLLATGVAVYEGALPWLYQREESARTGAIKYNYENIQQSKADITAKIEEWNRLDASIASLKKTAGNDDIIAGKQAQQCLLVTDVHQVMNAIPDGEIPFEATQFYDAHKADCQS